MRIGSLFSGAGGLDMAVQSVFGGDIVWHSEIDKAASKVLEYRFLGVPNLGDITKINWANWKPMLEVDVLCGGFPCQDVSAAGKRAGIKDGTRSGLWAVFADAIDALRPRYIVIENVRGLLSARAHRAVESDDAVVGDRSDRPVLRALGAVLGDLSNLGYDAQWTTIAAADVGAPHRRERVFILATDAQRGGGAWSSQPGWNSKEDSEGRQAVLAGGLSGSTDWELLQAVQSFDIPDGDEPGVALLPTPRSSRGASTTETTYAFGGVRSDDNRTQGEVLLPTPVSTDAKSAGRHSTTTGVMHSGTSLTDAVRLLPTPTSCDYKPTDSPSDLERHSPGLGAVSAHFPVLPTPSLSDVKTPRRGQQLEATLESGIHTLNLSDAVEQHHGRDAVESAWGKYAPAIARWEQIVGPAPAPTEPNKNNNPRLSAAFSEWLMGWPAGWVTDPDIGISRNDRLRIVGNGVCTQQAATAISYLLSVTA